MQTSKYILSLITLLALGCTFCLNADGKDGRRRGKGKGRGGEEMSKKGEGKGRRGHGRGRGHGKPGEKFEGRQAEGTGFGRGMWKGCQVKKEELRGDVKQVWEKFEELRKFKREQFKGEKGERPRFRDEKVRKEMHEKIDAKINEFELNFSKFDNLRKLKKLNLHERLAINKMENEIIKHELRGQPGAESSKIGAGEGKEFSPELPIPDYLRPSYGSKTEDHEPSAPAIGE